MTVNALVITVILIIATAALLAGVASPYLISWQTNRQRRQERLDDYARQDAVADRLLRGQELAARQVAATAQKTDQKLEVIHVLVNSNMTAAMQAALDATVTMLAVMRRLNILEPTAELGADIEATKQKIAELQAAVNDRLGPQDTEE